MKKILLIFIISISLMSYGKSINKKQLQNRNGVYYETNQETPYTGKAISYYEYLGQIKFKGNYKYGLKNGEFIWYYENGQIKFKYNYKYGEWIVYHENGQIRSKYNYKYGKKDGEWIVYHKNGQISIKQNFKDGKLIY